MHVGRRGRGEKRAAGVGWRRRVERPRRRTHSLSRRQQERSAFAAFRAGRWCGSTIFFKCPVVPARRAVLKHARCNGQATLCRQAVQVKGSVEPLQKQARHAVGGTENAAVPRFTGPRSAGEKKRLAQKQRTKGCPLPVFRMSQPDCSNGVPRGSEYYNR